MYDSYLNFINILLNNENIFLNFKSNNDYRHILEHVCVEQGLEYLKLIKNEFNIEDNKILNFVNLNDKIGNPIKNQIMNFSCSPTSLRYIYHSLLILKHVKNLNINNLKIVEIGAGYGGLCLALNFFKDDFNIIIEEYNIIDLDLVLKLQQKYLNNFKLDFNVNFIYANTHGKTLENNNYFLISNYCYSEIDEYNRMNYDNFLFPKVKNGFITWNHLPIVSLPSPFIFNSEVERPLTGQYNKYVRF